MQETDEAMPAPSTFAIGAGEILAMAWLCGVMALGGLLIGRWSYYFILLRHVSVETEDDVRKLVARLARQLGLRRRVEVLVTTRPFGPAVYGLWRPTLILPQILLKTDSPDHLRRIVAHELIHVRRWDNLVGALQLLVQIIWWFHPLVWWMNRRICREREYCCDEEVVASLNCEPDTYAQSLLDILKLKRQLRPALLPGVDAVEITTKRLEKIMSAQRKFHRHMPRAGWALLIAGILIIMPGAGFILPAGEAAMPSDSNDEPAATSQNRTKPRKRRRKSPGPLRRRSWKPRRRSARRTWILRRAKLRSPSIATWVKDFPGPAAVPIIRLLPKAKSPSGAISGRAFCPFNSKEGKYYRVGINSTSFENFSSVQGMPARPSAIYFTTKGADEKLVKQTSVPEIVSMDPPNEASDVDPSIKELRVTFNVPMGGGFSWTGGGPRHPQTPRRQEALLDEGS